MGDPIEKPEHLAGELARRASPAAKSNFSGDRLDSVDLLRGLAMVVMALDHVRDYFTHYPYPPEDLAHTTPGLFLTRWVTHFCAPIFVFLAGTGAFLYGARGRSKKQLAWFLLTRGLWLMILELTLVRIGWTFNFDYHFFIGQVIWAIGCSMVVLAGLVFLPTWAVTLAGISIIALHNVGDRIEPEFFGRFGDLWAVLHVRFAPLRHDGFVFLVVYPLLPWIGVMAAGYGFGSLLLQEQPKRRRSCLVIGLALTVAFVAIRYGNAYGDPEPWSQQSREPAELYTLFSFLKCEKYPPSLLFLLMTLGPSIAALALFDRKPGLFGRGFVTFGRVPLFYYLLHLPLIHALAVGLDYLRYGRSPLLSQPAFAVPPSQYPDSGISLPAVYLVWLSVVVILYPVCLWFAGIKRRYRNGWLSYL